MTGLIIIMIGLLLSTVDICVITAAQYPEYQMVYDDLGLGEVIQKYVADNMFGSSLELILHQIYWHIYLSQSERECLLNTAQSS